MNEQAIARRKERLPFLVAVEGAAVLLLVTLLLPLGFDNDVYESMAWTLYAYHGLPYLASWDMTFPGIVFIHWASIALFGASDFGFRLFDYLVHIGMAALYYLVLRRWLSRRESVIAVLLYALYYASGQWGLAGQRDTYAAFVLLGAMLCFLRLKGDNNWVLTSLMGLLCGSAFLIRPTYIFFVAAFLILLWKFPRSYRTMSFFVIGCLVPSVVCLMPYIFVRGGLMQVYYSIIRFNLDVYSSVAVPHDFLNRGRAPIFVSAIIGIVLRFYRKDRTHFERPHRDRMLIVLLTICSFLSPIVMRKYFSYHFEPFMLIAIAFASMGLSEIVTLLKIPSLQYVALTAGLFLFIYAYYPKHLLRYYYQNIPTGRPLEATYERVLSDSLFGLVAQREVKGYLDRRLGPNDRVEYASLFPGLRWRLARSEATRFTTLVPIVIAGPNARNDYLASWKKEFIDSLSSARPKFIILSKSLEWWPFVSMTADRALHSIPGFDSLLAANYRIDTVIRGYELYRIKSQ